jgi:hypothetical protein
MFVAANILVWAYAGLVVYVFLHAGKDWWITDPTERPSFSFFELV